MIDMTDGRAYDPTFPYILRMITSEVATKIDLEVIFMEDIRKAMMEARLENLESQLQGKMAVADTYLEFKSLQSTESVSSIMMEMYKLDSEVSFLRQECYVHNYPDLVAKTYIVNQVCAEYYEKLRRL